MTWAPTCGIAITAGDLITLAHGEGGRLSRKLLAECILPTLGDAALASLDDATMLPSLAGAPVVTTDSFVVSPLFFPGGDIGSLAVYGAINDLAVAGARPRWLTLSLILEESLPLATLRTVLESIRATALKTGVVIVAGDTKVVPRGVADQMFITITALGELLLPAPAGPHALSPGDEIVISGPIGRHGVAILAAREQLGFEPPPVSDCGSLFEATEALRCAHIPVKAMRDATRGGLGAVLHEWAATSGCTLELDEAATPVTQEVRGACELLGLDPIFIACEGTMAVAVAAGNGEAAAHALRNCVNFEQAAVIGRVAARSTFPVTVQRLFGKRQPLDDPAGRLMPRIC
jgi:hydrogenase expression/formation protein HypE